MENEYLKKLRAQQKSKKVNTFQIIDKMRKKYPLNSLCHFAGRSRSGYTNGKIELGLSLKELNKI